jgi:hypothetical protein
VRKVTLLVSLALMMSVLAAPPASAVAPTVDSFDPASGPVGTEVTITGSDFTGATGVAFDGTAAVAFTIDSDVQITATVPAGATTGPITVTNADGPGSSATNFTVTPTPTPPNISGFNPRRGPIGTQVTIRGMNLDDVNRLRLRGKNVNFTILSPTRIRFRVPPGAKSGRISARSPDGSDTSNGSFLVRKDKHRSVITFELSGHIAAAGRVKATDGERVCRTQRRVKVQRQSGGSWRTVRGTRTAASGNYRVQLPDTTGTYRAVVTKKATARDICSGDESKTRKHKHASPGGGDGGGGGGRCDPAYPTVCIPSPPPDLDCGQVQYTNFVVRPPDPHNFDSDGDGRGCESGRRPASRIGGSGES